MNAPTSLSRAQVRIEQLERQNKLLLGTATQSARIRELWTRSLAELKETKSKLQDSRDFLELLLATAPLPIFVLGRFAHVRMLNAAAEELLAAPTTAIKGRNALRYLLPEDRVKLIEALRTANAQDVTTIEARIALAPDTRRLLEIHWALLPAATEDLGRVIAVVQDITERHRAEEALRLTQFAVDRAADGVFWLDPEGRFVYVNEAASHALGYTRAELVGMSVHDIDTRLPREAWPDHWQSLRNRGCLAFESTHRTKSGRTFPVEIVANHMRFAGREYNCAFARDISERKRLERERLLLQEQLVRASREAGMAEVATGVLHNVGNALTSLNVSATLAAEKVRRLRIAGLQQLVRLFEEQGDQLGNFISHDPKGKRLPAYLGALSRKLTREREAIDRELCSVLRDIEHIKGVITTQQAYAQAVTVIEPVEIAALLDDAVRMSISGRHEIQILRDYANLPVVRTDRHTLLQVMINLLKNAKESLNEKGGEKWLAIRLLPDNSERLRVEIQDNGAGIAPENLSRVFEYGYSTKPGGHGFGLHMSATAVKTLGGMLGADSDGPGCGALFWLTLPFAAEAER